MAWLSSPLIIRLFPCLDYHESVILQKTSLKGLILIIKSTYQGWYHALTLSHSVRPTDYSVVFTPVPTPCSYSWLSYAHRFMGFSRNQTFVLASVWEASISSRCIFSSFITRTPFTSSPTSFCFIRYNKHTSSIINNNTGIQTFSWKEFHVHSGEVLSSHDPANWISTSDTLPRFFTNRHVHHLLFQFVSQHNVLFLPNRTQKHLHQDFWRSEVHVRRLGILELLVIVWFVSIVLVLVVTCWFGCFSWPILVILLYVYVPFT